METAASSSRADSRRRCSWLYAALLHTMFGRTEPDVRKPFSAARTSERPRTLEAAATSATSNTHQRVRRKGVLIFSHYYAKDTPATHQHATNIACVALFSLAGTTARYFCGELAAARGLTPNRPAAAAHGADDTSAPSSRLDDVLFRDLLANSLGAFLMGVAVGFSPYVLPRFPNLYVGFTTGFCGCLTTFSSWNASAAAILVTGAYDRAIMCLAIGLAASTSCLHLGRLLGSQLVPSRVRELLDAATVPPLAPTAPLAPTQSEGATLASSVPVALVPASHTISTGTTRTGMEHLNREVGQLGPAVASITEGLGSAKRLYSGQAKKADGSLEVRSSLASSLAEIPIEEVDDSDLAHEMSAEDAEGALPGAGPSPPYGSIGPSLRRSFGRSLSYVIAHPVPPIAREQTAFPLFNTWKLPVSLFAITLALCSCTVAAVMSAMADDFSALRVLVALLLSPPFALARYLLSFRNRHHPRFPMYTLLCNVFGSILSATCAALLRPAPSISGATGSGVAVDGAGGAHPGSEIVVVAQALLAAVSLGAAGSLSTVSSFVNELRLLSLAHAARYATVTLMLGQAIGVAVHWILQASAIS